MARFAGKLHTWNEERGFGFIRPSDGGQDIFVHVSALPTPRPQPEEVLTFELGLNREGQKKAVEVRRQQVEAAGLLADSNRGSRRYASRPLKSSPLERLQKLVGLVLSLVVVGALAWLAYHQFRRTFVPLPSVTPARCDGRQYCSQMTSCKEAKFFLRNCPGTQMDGNNDGVPCESQWCKWPWSP